MNFDTSLALKLAPLYLLVAIGFAMGRFMHLKSAEVGKLALYVLSPAVVFKGFYGARLDGAVAMLPFAVFALSAGFGLLALAGGRRLWRDGRERIAAFAAGTGNTGFFGIPACLSLIGPDSLPYVVMVSFGATAYENSVGFFIVARSQATVGGAILRVLRYPGLHACWLGMALNLGHVGLPAAIPQTIDLLAAGYSGVGMMIVGLGLSQVARLKLDVGFTAWSFLWKFLAWPAAAAGFVWADRHALHLFGEVAHKVLAVEALVPMAAVTVVHATLQNVHPDRAAVSVAASTLFALAYLPVAFGMIL